MIEFVEPSEKCWWCGAIADSTEHRIKKSDIINEFGRGPYKGDDQVVVGNDEGLRRINGPGSKEIRFKKNLCQNCNNNKSSSFDLAYQCFTSYLKENESQVLEKSELHWPDIYGNRWLEEKENLLRYYVKHACCRLSDFNVKIHPEVIDYLESQSEITCFAYFSEIRLDIVALIMRMKRESFGDGNLWTGPLYYDSNAQKTEFYNVYSFLGYRWFRMYWQYDTEIGPPNLIDKNQDTLTLTCKSIGDPQRILEVENLDEYLKEII